MTVVFNVLFIYCKFGIYGWSQKSTAKEETKNMVMSTTLQTSDL